MTQKVTNSKNNKKVKNILKSEKLIKKTSRLQTRKVCIAWKRSYDLACKLMLQVGGNINMLQYEINIHK